jgi:hypothetical protein
VFKRQPKAQLTSLLLPWDCFLAVQLLRPRPPCGGPHPPHLEEWPALFSGAGQCDCTRPAAAARSSGHLGCEERLEAAAMAAQQVLADARHRCCCC